MITIRSQFNEKIDWIVAGEDLGEQLFRANAVADMDPIFPIFIRIACIEDEKICGIPEGIPDTVKFEEDLPDGIADTTLRQEIRRIRNFQARGDMQRVSRLARESKWIEILESVHPKEARMLTMIKDQTLFYQYPVLFDIMKELTGREVDLPRQEVASPKVEEPTPVVGLSDGLTPEVTEPVLTETPVPKKRGRKPKVES